MAVTMKMKLKKAKEKLLVVQGNGVESELLPMQEDLLFHDVIMVVEVLVMDMGEVLDWKKVKLRKRMKKKRMKKKRMNSPIMMIVVTEEIVGVISTMKRGLAS
jgi:hypothetical protein